MTVLACSDSTIRVVSDKGKVLVEQRLGSPVNTLSLFDLKDQQSRTLLAYGLQNGNFGVAEITSEDVIVL